MMRFFLGKIQMLVVEVKGMYVCDLTRGALMRGGCLIG